MSDGPFKSPKLARHLRDFAEIACSPASTQTQRQDAGKRALKIELEKLPLQKIMQIIRGEEQGSLSFGEPDSRIEKLKDALLNGPRGLGSVGIEDCGTEAILDGLTGDEAVRSTLKNTVELLRDNVVSSLKELAQRHAGDPSAHANCQALESASQSLDINSIVSELMSSAGSRSKTGRIPKQMGPDVGALLP